MKKTTTVFELARKTLFNLPLIGSPLESFLRDSYKRRVIRKDYPIPKAMHVELNNTCNLNCDMCPRHELKDPSAILNFELYQKIVDDMAKVGIKNVSLFIFGEPLLYPKIVEAIKYAKSGGISVKFNSNGMLMTSEKAKAIIEAGIDEVHFSLDGLNAEKYPKVRIGGNFETVTKNILKFIEIKNELKLNKPKIVLKAIANFNTPSEIKEFKSFWKDKVDQIFMGELSTFNQQRMHRFFPRKKYTPKYCTFPFNHLVVTSNGYYAPCCLYYFGKELNLGSARELSISEVWNGSKLKKIREIIKEKKIRDIPACNKCLS